MQKFPLLLVKLIGLALFIAVISYFSMAGLFGMMLRHELSRNPEIVINAIQQWQQQGKFNHKQTEPATHDEINAIYEKIIATGHYPYLGNKDGKKILVEFFDYNCPYCQAQLSEIKKLITKDKNVKVVLVDTPILSASSVDLSYITLLAWQEAAGKKQFIALHEKILFAKKPIDTKTLQVLIAKQGLNWQQLTNNESNREKIKEQLKKNLALQQSLDITGTPALLYRHYIRQGYTELTTLQQILLQ